MRYSRKTTLLVLLILLVAATYGLIRTGRAAGAPEAGAAPASAPEQSALVDQTPLLTAQGFAHAPTSSSELPFAQAALQIGDQEMDLAFALAILDVTQHPPVLSAAAKQLQARVNEADDALAAQQMEVTQLTAAAAKAAGARQDALNDQLDLAKAQLELRQDEVDDAKQELINAGGDPQDRIQAMVQEHEDASKASDATKVSVSAPAEPHGLIQHFEQWSALHQKQLQLWAARQDALSLATALAARHNSIEQSSGGAQNDASPSPAVASPQESAAMVNMTKRRAADRKTLATLDKRVDNEKKLAGVYEQWIAVVQAEQRTLVNRGLRGVLIILGIATLGLFVDGWLAGLLGRLSMDRRQTETLRAATRVSLQIVGLLLILLVIFGPPTQLGTFLGLAGAGLTVALKDFIIGFFGWFVLMGKNGIRMGDWVEINGVTGEVVELGMFHTVLLETGNWTDSGHPTGRRVTFTNGFAVEGHYFNFSTSGQWLWDELHLVLPAGQNPYPIVDAIHKKVVEATAQGAQQAEQEWRRAAKSRGMTALSTEPSINVKPVIGGTEISVRYMTRANERSAVRAQLNHVAVDLLGSGFTSPDAASPNPALTPG